MRRFARFAVAVAAIAMLSGMASAASLVFTSPGPGNQDGIVRVDMWMHDPTRSQTVSALQFDLDICPAGCTSSLATPPDFVFPNVVRIGGTGPNLTDSPFDLTPNANNPVGDPAGPIDVRAVHASSDLFTINSLAQGALQKPTCLDDFSDLACNLANQGLAQNRIYLGSFNLSYNVGGVFLRLQSIFGEDDLEPQDPTDPLILELRFEATRMDGGNCNDTRGCRVEGLAPEPAGLALLGIALGAMSLIRRRSA